MTERSAAVGYSHLTRRRVRTDSLEQQRTSTFRLLAEAIRQRDDAAARELAEFALGTECAFIRDLMREWRAGLLRLLAEGGRTPAEIERTLAGLREVLALPPNGAAYHEDQAWSGFRTIFDELNAALDAARHGDALALAERAATEWRVVHDREIDLTYGLMSAYVEDHGEASVPAMFESIGQGHIAEFFELADPKERDWEGDGRSAVLLDTIEAMRVHLSSTWRDGEPFELVEHDDRWVFSFDPCGSGGRAVRGDWVEGTPSRIEPPYNFATIKEAYPWTDGKQGLCVYCSHCILMYEQAPMDRGGIPFLVVEPPTYPDNERADDRRQQCTYTIYKTAAAIPDEIYERAGRTRE